MSKNNLESQGHEEYWRLKTELGSEGPVTGLPCSWVSDRQSYSQRVRNTWDHIQTGRKGDFRLWFGKTVLKKPKWEYVYGILRRHMP